MKATYIKTSPTGVFNVSRIVTVHYYEFDKSFTFAGESHDFWEMVYVDRGQVMVSRDGEELLLSQGELVFHKPHEFHAIRAHGSAPNFFVISFVCTSAAMQSFERYRTRPEPGMTPLISGMMREAEGAYVLPRNDPTLRRLVRRVRFQRFDQVFLLRDLGLQGLNLLRNTGIQGINQGCLVRDLRFQFLNLLQ